MLDDLAKKVVNTTDRIEYLKSEVALLRTQLILEDRPFAKLTIEENIQETLEMISALEASLKPLKNKEKKDKSKKQKATISSTAPKNMSNGSIDTREQWYKKPVGIIGISVISGVLVLIVAYLIKEHFGIPL